jgi:hypothetical protein
MAAKRGPIRPHRGNLYIKQLRDARRRPQRMPSAIHRPMTSAKGGERRSSSSAKPLIGIGASALQVHHAGFQIRAESPGCAASANIHEFVCEMLTCQPSWTHAELLGPGIKSGGAPHPNTWPRDGAVKMGLFDPLLRPILADDIAGASVWRPALHAGPLGRAIPIGLSAR